MKISRHFHLAQHIALLLAATFLFPVAARSAEKSADKNSDQAFQIVASGDALYRNLAVLQRAGWMQSSAGASTQLTRYEIAVETAKAVAFVTAHQGADSTWMSREARAPRLALRENCRLLKIELDAMGVNTRRVLGMLDGEAKETKTPSRALTLGKTEASPAVTTVASAAVRDLPMGERSTGLRLGLTNRLALGAGVFSRNMNAPLAINDLPVDGVQRVDSVGGGLDVALSPAMSLTGRVESVSAQTFAGSPSWMRYSGGIGMKTLSNRLSLSANLSRLVPQNTNGAATNAAGVNIDLGVSERVKFKLLYQQLFGNSAMPDGSTRVAGGVSLNF